MKQVRVAALHNCYLHYSKRYLPSKINFMKRILFVSAGSEFPKGAMSFLQLLQQHEPLSAFGLFFDSVDLTLMASASHIPGTAIYDRLKARERNISEINKTEFSMGCEKFYIKYHIHPSEGEWDKDIFARESRFSDLIILSGEAFFSDITPGQPNPFLQEALHAAECPVMILPENFVEFQHVVIAYDGSKDSLFALKQFCYLFPRFTDLPTEVVYVRDENSGEIPDIDVLRQYTRLQFQSLNFSKLHFKAARYFATWIGEKDKTLLVSGSFGRSPFSYVAKQSFAEQVIHDHKMPIFIAHT